jgi:hypothetical protein
MQAAWCAMRLVSWLDMEWEMRPNKAKGQTKITDTLLQKRASGAEVVA